MLSTFQRLVLATLTGGALLIALVLAAKGPALAGSTAVTFPTAGGTATMILPPYGGGPTPGVLTVGDAIVRIKPDIAVIGAGVTAQAATAAEAQARTAERMARVLAQAKALGIAERDIKQSGYSITPTYSFDRGEQRITGYQAMQQLTLTLRKVEDAGKAVDALVQNEGATNATVSFSLDDPKPAQAEARRLAIADARAKAQAMADAAGVRLGSAISVSEAGGGMPVPMPFKGAAGPVGADSVATQLPPSDLEIVVRIQVQFAIN